MPQCEEGAGRAALMPVRRGLCKSIAEFKVIGGRHEEFGTVRTSGGQQRQLGPGSSTASVSPQSVHSGSG